MLWFCSYQTVPKLSQCSANPVEIHYKAARQLMKYLALTKTQGITYWRKQLLQMLPHQQNEPCVLRSEILHTIPHHTTADQSHSFVDDDWGGTDLTDARPQVSW